MKTAIFKPNDHVEALQPRSQLMSSHSPENEDENLKNKSARKSSSGHSTITDWLKGLKGAEAESIQEQWQNYFDKLALVAQNQLKYKSMLLAEGEDIAASAFASVCSGFNKGRFQDVTHLDEVWFILLAVAQRKCVDHYRQAKALKRGGDVKTLSFDQNPQELFIKLTSQVPTSEEVIAFNEELDRLLDLLDDPKMRRIAVLRLEGHTIAEAAREVNVADVTVNRKLKIIRQRWKYEFNDGQPE